MPIRKIRSAPPPVEHPVRSRATGVSQVLVDRRRNVLAQADDLAAAAQQSTELVVGMPNDDNVILPLIARGKSEIREHRGSEYLHVSDLLSKCQRKRALIERHNLPRRANTITFMESLTYAQGTTLADVVINRVISGSTTLVWGQWKCTCGYLYHDEPCLHSEVDQEDVCERCGTATNTYVEVPMYNEALKIVGRPDLLLYFRQFDAFYVTELKSIAHKQWEELVRAKPEHVIQALFYWWLMRELGYRVMDTISILYTTKGYVFKGGPCLEFQFNAPAELHRLDIYLTEARELKDARDGGSLPPRTMCVTDRAPNAKSCEVCHLCFNDSPEGPQEVDLTGLFDGVPEDQVEAAHARTKVRRSNPDLSPPSSAIRGRNR